MAQKLDVSVTAEDSGLPYRATRIRIRGTTVAEGPVRVVDVKNVSTTSVGKALEGLTVFEAYKKPSPSSLRTLTSDQSATRRYNAKWQGIKELAGASPLLVFLDYNLTKHDDMRYPDDNELRFMIRTIHAYSDFSTVPLVSGITDYLVDDGTSYDKYLNYTKRALEYIESFNKNPIMGTIPLRSPFTRIGELVNLYLKDEVRAFALDFSCSKPETPIQNLEEVLAVLAENDALDSSYIHALNVSPGRPRSKTQVSLSSNILSPGYNIDSFGDLHRAKIRTPDGVKRISPTRLFSRLDYGNHMVTEDADIRSVYPDKSCVSLSDLSHCLVDKNIMKLFNTEQQAAELNSIKSMIVKRDGSKDMEQYLKAKEQVKEPDIKCMRRLGNSLKDSKRR